MAKKKENVEDLLASMETPKKTTSNGKEKNYLKCGDETKEKVDRLLTITKEVTNLSSEMGKIKAELVDEVAAQREVDVRDRRSGPAIGDGDRGARPEHLAEPAPLRMLNEINRLHRTIRASFAVTPRPGRQRSGVQCATNRFMSSSCSAIDSTSLNCVRQRMRLWFSRCTLK